MIGFPLQGSGVKAAMDDLAGGRARVECGFPGQVNINETEFVLWKEFDRAVTIDTLHAVVDVAPVDTNIVVTWYKRLKTGGAATAIGTVTILAGAKSGTATISEAILATECVRGLPTACDATPAEAGETLTTTAFGS